MANLANGKPFANFLPTKIFFLESVLATRADYLLMSYSPVGVSQLI